MNTLQFKTTISCSGCLAKVTPFLNEESDIAKWNLDLQNPEKILTVESSEANPEKIIKAVEKAGFKIEQLKN